jgi:hypothetical protein
MIPVPCGIRNHCEEKLLMAVTAGDRGGRARVGEDGCDIANDHPIFVLCSIDVYGAILKDKIEVEQRCRSNAGGCSVCRKDDVVV